MREGEVLAHKVATWIGVVGLLIAILIPLANALGGWGLEIEWSYLTAVLGVLFVGSKRVRNTVTEWIRAWKGND